MKNIHKIGKELFITSDEEIKDGDWMIRNNEQPIKVTEDFFWDFGVRYYKIILTTDQSLDGVQSIDDDFLEWFVQNPSCKEVEVEIKPMFPMYSTFIESIDDPPFYGNLKRKIIIPKEEPKDVVLGYKTSIVAQMLDSNIKQETLEEAAERQYKFEEDSAFPDDREHQEFIRIFKKGAKWQQKQILQFLYSEITERRDYSASKMCEVVIEFIEQLNTKK